MVGFLFFSTLKAKCMDECDFVYGHASQSESFSKNIRKIKKNIFWIKS